MKYRALKQSLGVKGGNHTRGSLKHSKLRNEVGVGDVATVDDRKSGQKDNVKKRKSGSPTVAPPTTYSAIPARLKSRQHQTVEWGTEGGREKLCSGKTEDARARF